MKKYENIQSKNLTQWTQEQNRSDEGKKYQ